MASTRLERCLTEESARLAGRRANAARRWRLDRRRGVEALAEGLPTEPWRVVPELRASAEGCSWLLARWRPLRVALEGRGHWTEEEHGRALHLLGLSEEPHRRELGACRLGAAQVASTGEMEAEAASAEGRLSADEGRDWLAREADREMGRLRRMRAALRVDRRRDLGRVADLVLFDDSPSAARMHRYEAAAMNDLRRCIALLATLRSLDPCRPRPGPGVDPATNEPTPDASTGRVLDVVAASQVIDCTILEAAPAASVGGVDAADCATNEPNRAARRRPRLVAAVGPAAASSTDGPTPPRGAGGGVGGPGRRA